MAVRLVPPPPRVFRICRPHDPFNWRARQEPLPEGPDPVLVGRRWDDPEAEFATVYCGSSAETAFAKSTASQAWRKRSAEFFDSA